MSVAIYYHPEAYTTSGPKLMGRNAAGESFLRGFLTHTRSSEFWIQVENAVHANHFAQTAKFFERSEPIKVIDKKSLSVLSQVGTVYLPGPSLGRQAFERAAYGHAAWSLCGITHTTSSAGAMDSLAELLTAPVQSWDAVICTSTAVKDNVTKLLQAQAEYLQNRLGISKLVLPQLPIIPLGIQTQDFTYTNDQKAEARAALGVMPETLVVLFMGRLSFHAKAHPLAMYQALEKASRATGKQVLLVECGWHANDFIQEAYADAVRMACPSVRVITLDGRQAQARQTAWAGADVFCSLSDNIQETFGIAPIEAMAAGLPVVVSDWDGYKDTVRHGIDGFRIPTTMPQAGLAGDLALRHALEIDTYDMYCGHTCSLVAVDVQAVAHAFVQLFESPELRRQMGNAGQQRALEVYDWKNIIGQYESLWKQQNELRLSQASTLQPLAHPWPARMDPFHAFSAYPSRSLTPATSLDLVENSPAKAMEHVRGVLKLAMINFATTILPSESEVEAMLLGARSWPIRADALVQPLPVHRQLYALRSLAWLLKVGILKTTA